MDGEIGFDESVVWQAARDAGHAVFDAASVLRKDRGRAAALIRSGLLSHTFEALLLLGALDHEFTCDVIDRLVDTALSHRHTLAVRQVLGRLPHDLAAEVVPPAVRALLLREGDDDAYRRSAELLDHLGLHAALQDLCSTAALSDDPYVRDVAEDFAP